MIFEILILFLNLIFIGIFLNVYDGRRVKKFVKNDLYLSLLIYVFFFV